MLQALCEQDPNATILSIDGTGAFDFGVSRCIVAQGLHNVSPSSVPFARQFYGMPWRYLWEDDGDPPTACSLGSVRHYWRSSACWGGVNYFCVLGHSHEDFTGLIGTSASLQQELWRHARIQVHDGKTQVWNSAGLRPVGCDTLDRVARATDPHFTTVWRGSGLPLSEQGIRILGTPLGHEEYVRSHLQRTIEAHTVLLERIPAVPDVIVPTHGRIALSEWCDQSW